MATHDTTDPALVQRTDEGGQAMAPADITAAAERLRELGAVLYRSESDTGVDKAIEIDLETELQGAPDDETMIINMGPQHPSTHGVLRLMLELRGETVLRCKPVLGYLHTGMEWTGEELTYLQGSTNVTRMDYAAPLFSELAFSTCV